MKKSLHIFGGVVLCICGMVLIAGCSSMRLGQTFDEEVDFTQLKSFDWLPRTDKARTTEAQDARLRSRITKCLISKGYIQDSTNPDFFIIYHTDVESGVNVERRGYNYSDKYSYFYWDETHVAGRVDQAWILVIDCIDSEKQKLIWRGIAAAKISENKEHLFKKVEAAVSRVLKFFPDR